MLYYRLMAKKTPKKPLTKKQRLKTVRRSNKQIESDGSYFLKLVCLIVAATMWLKFADPLHIGPLIVAGFPLGACLALLWVAIYEREQIDRKIWYGVVVVVAIICFFIPAGIMV